MIFVDSNIPMYLVGASHHHKLHVAIMARHSVTQLMSIDRGFDNYPGITRLN